MRTRPALPLVLLLGCDPADSGAAYEANCAKVFCAEDEYCRRESDTALPVCTEAPAACGGTASCACLSGCATCTEADGLVRCDATGE